MSSVDARLRAYSRPSTPVVVRAAMDERVLCALCDCDVRAFITDVTYVLFVDREAVPKRFLLRYFRGKEHRGTHTAICS